MNTQALKFLGAALIGFFMAWAWFAPVEQDHEHGHDHEHHHDHHDHDDEPEEIALAEQDLQEHGITTVQVEQGKVNPEIELKGKLIFHPDMTAHVLPKLAGAAVEVRKKLGDPVQQGDVLALLESKEMADAKAAYLNALSDEELTLSRYQSQQALDAKRLASRADVENAQNAYEEAVIAKNLAAETLLAYGIEEAELKKLEQGAEKDYRIYAVKAPFAGTVIARHLSLGEYVEGTEQIFEIANLKKVWVEVPVPRKYLDQFKKTETVRVAFSCSDETYQAPVVYVTPFIADDSITGKAIAEVRNEKGSYCPGEFVSVYLESPSNQPVKRIPKIAVQEMEGEKVVFVREGEQFRKQAVETGAEDRLYYEVVQGLNEGDTIASEGSFLLKADFGKHSLEHEH